MTVQRVRKLSVEVEAMRHTGENNKEIQKWARRLENGRTVFADGSSHLRIKTFDGENYAEAGDWVIHGANGEFYPCKPDIFEKTYEILPATSW